MLNIAKEVAAMERMTVDGLRARYAEVFGERTNGQHKQWLIKRIAWRMQANAEGDLSERARRRAAELANDAFLRMMPPREKVQEQSVRSNKRVASPGDHRLPMPGTVITREYKGRTVEVKVLNYGFDFEGEVYKSLSAVAKAATGSHWNGFLFFRLRKKEAAV